MLNTLNRFVPLDIWVDITHHLQAQDVVNASMACRCWYKELAHQKLWEATYRSILPKYPIGHFLVPDLVENAKRFDFIPLDGSEPQVLDRWQQSYKQRTIYLLHIIYVQSSCVQALRERTSSFVDPSPEPYYTVSRINKLEAFLDATLPIDFVIFMAFYAHQVRTDKQLHDNMSMSIASGWGFDHETDWQMIAEEFNPRRFDKGREVDGDTRLENISRTAEAFLRQLKIIPFSNVSNDDPDYERVFLSLMLSKNDCPSPNLPDSITNDAYAVNFENMTNGAGKVFINIVIEETHFKMHYVSESFTDYFIQYTGVALEYGEVPKDRMIGSMDLSARLPNDQSPRRSILLPQPVDWDIGNYFPTYFTSEEGFYDPSVFTVKRSRTNTVRDRGPVSDFDNPDSVPVNDPPLDMFCGCFKRNWRPYVDFLAARDPPRTVNRLADFGSGGYLPTSNIEINQDIYDILQRMTLQWMSSTASTIATSRSFNEQEKEQIREKTMDLMELFKLHQRCLPVSIYYEGMNSAVLYLFAHKYFQDHVDGMRDGTPKYSMDELYVICSRFKYQLNQLGYNIGRFSVPRDRRGIVPTIRDLCNLPDLNWNELKIVKPIEMYSQARREWVHVYI